jgi:hypothetical protein
MVGEVLDKTSSFNSKLEKEEIEIVAPQEENPFTQSEAERKLVKKMNWTFAPFLCLVLFIQVIKILWSFILSTSNVCHVIYSL